MCCVDGPSPHRDGLPPDDLLGGAAFDVTLRGSVQRSSKQHRTVQFAAGAVNAG
jgi:hypothetical protein